MQPTRLRNINRRSVIVGLLILAFVTFRSVAAQPINNPSKISELAESPQWLALLHYHRANLNRWESLADDPKFFLTKDGKYSPEAELSEHLRRVKEPELRCQFVARYAWLSQQFNFAFDPLKECVDFSTWYGNIKPKALTLVFPSVFINNPASAFGHTFLRIDSPDGEPLTAYAANYAAATGGENALFYALMGIFGGYQGFFSVAPYYEQVKKYSDRESRDIWEYALSFSEAETTRVVQHLWELRRIAFDYYYFDENCSYHLLSLFDVARPELQLVDRFKGYVLPVDTLRAIIKKDGLVQDAKYRPAALTSLRHRLAVSDIALQKQAKAMIETNQATNDSSDPQERARVVELAQDYLGYLALKGKVSEDQSRALGYKLLVERSKIGKQDTFELPEAPEPSTGHDSLRLSLAAGALDGKGFYDLGLRPVYHSRTDPAEAYTLGSQLELGDLVLRQMHEDDLKLQRFDLVDIYSLSPRDTFVKPISWRLKIGTERRTPELGRVSALDLGFGQTYGDSQLIFYGLVGPSVEYADKFQDQNYQVNLQYSAGMMYAGKGWGLDLDADYSNSLAGNNYEYAQISLSPRVSIDKNSQLRLDLVEHYYDGDFQEEAKLLIEFFL
jgi:hypothetical protein